MALSTKKLVGIAGLGVIGYLAWKKGLLGGAQGLLARAEIAEEVVAASELDACGNAPMAASAWLYGSQGVAEDSPGGPDLSNARTAAMVGGAVTRVASSIPGPVGAIGGTVAGIGTAVATTLFSIFSSTPPDPVIRLVIGEMPYNWATRSNLPPEGGRWALDRCGFIHEVLGDFHAAGYLDREVVAVNWKVFQMMPQGEPITSADEIEHARMPRPGDAAVLRRTLGQDIRFYIGREERLRGPWDADSHVPPLAGSPAMWAAIAGDYAPTYTPSRGEF